MASRKRRQTVNVDGFVHQVRQLFIDQRMTWRLIPELAVEAQGRHGYDDRYTCAYSEKLWPIDIIPFRRIGWICLESGRLLALYNTRKVLEPEYCLLLAAHLSTFNAENICSELRKEVTTRIPRGFTPMPDHQRAHLRQRVRCRGRRGPIDIGHG